MTTISEQEKYIESLNALGIPRDKDPFPFDPPEQVDYWADNKEGLKKIIQTQIDSVMFDSSFIYVLFGPVGGGKTFAVKYLANPKIQRILLENLNRQDFKLLNFRVASVVPIRTGQLTFSLYRDIVKKCFSLILADDDLTKGFKEAKNIGEGNLKAAFTDVKKSLVREFDGKISIRNIEKTEGYKFLTLDRSKLGKLQDVNELVEIIGILIKIIGEKYNRIIISIDELENLFRASGTERVLCSDFLRKMHELIEHDMTLFLIFTLDSFEDVNLLLQPALLSRVKEFIEFTFIKNKADIKEYITGCIAQRCGLDPLNVIEENVIDEIADSLLNTFRGRVSFRQINREMHKIFADAYVCCNTKGFKIDNATYKKIAKGITADEVVKKIIGKTT
ncbi:MAG: hypothetical protein QW279_12090 [Candidatus Jordarchaeaceae archaeon]